MAGFGWDVAYLRLLLAFLEAQDIIPREKVKTMPPPQPSPASSSATAVSFSAVSSNARKRARASGSWRGSTLGFEEDEDVKPADKRARLSLDLERRVRELKVPSSSSCLSDYTKTQRLCRASYETLKPNLVTRIAGRRSST